MNDYIVVSNSTPIILLDKIGCLDLLRQLYSKIYIAKAVYKEVIIDGAKKIKEPDFLSEHKWIEIIEVSDMNAKKIFITSLHDGEVETMLLAMEKSADLCILDDLLARKYAKKLCINTTGTLGVLIAAKKKGFIETIKPLLNNLTDIGMFIDDNLYNEVLLLANEL